VESEDFVAVLSSTSSVKGISLHETNLCLQLAGFLRRCRVDEGAKLLGHV
jgi:hypothetical protein